MPRLTFIKKYDIILKKDIYKQQRNKNGASQIMRFLNLASPI